MEKSELEKLERRALAVREHIVRMSTDGGCFIGASLSCADLLVYLYSSVLRVDPSNPGDPNRDFLLLSKGHDVPALYGTLVELGFFARERLSQHLKTTDSLYWHPNRAVPGVEFHSGSLGHLLSVGIGLCLDTVLRTSPNRVFVILGDGELNEGSIWEAALVAAAKKLDRLVAIVDRNGFQANIETEALVPLESIEAKFEAFGWATKRIDGHSFSAMEEAFQSMPFETGRPTAIIADTVRGKGLPSIEARADRWFVNFSHAEVEMLLKELRGESEAKLTSDALHVR